MRHRIFLLSPANLNGPRARMVKVSPEGEPIAKVFTFISSLYFRGKLAYSEAFAAPPGQSPAALIITANRGLVPGHQLVTEYDLSGIAAVPIDCKVPEFREPLERDARLLAAEAGPDCDIVLLGSVASGKYVDPLVAIFGERLVFPADFVGRGDMSRGGLMLRCARERRELQYIPVLGAQRRGRRPPKLDKL